MVSASCDITIIYYTSLFLSLADCFCPASGLKNLLLGIVLSFCTMAKTRIAFSMLCASVAFASPFLSAELEDTFASLNARKEKLDDRKTIDEICEHELNDSNPKVAQDIWRLTGADHTLDITAFGGSYNNWVRNMDHGVFRKHQSDSWDCASLNGTCEHAADCSTFLPQPSTNVKS